ncbi:MAG TPA: ACS family MFS transporter [Candidatus Binataceae bacterium]|nr:ACS family MFS transporter [Candidatus Binataceae bacterium]
MQRELATDLARPLAWPRRFTVVALFFAATVLCYIDRVSISVAIIPLAHDRGYDAAAQGIILSAFFWGYLWPQLLGGWMSDRFGGRRVLAAGVAVWSLATLLTPPASRAFGLLIATRVLLGLGEGVNFPAIHSICARWTLAEERSRVIALNFSGIHLGTVTAFLVSPAIIVAFGWHALFYLAGALGIVWVCLWLWRTSETPESDPDITREELAAIMEGRPPAPPAVEIPWRIIMHEKAVWAIAIAHLCNNFGFYILLLWLPTYLDKSFSMTLPRVGLYSIVPWVSTFICSNIAGWLADRMMRGGYRTVTVRKTLQNVSFIGGSLPLLLLPSVSSPIQAIILVTLSVACNGFGTGAFAANHLDIAPRYAGILMGISNTVATVPGIIGVAATGFVLRATGSFSAVFYLIAIIYMFGALGYNLWASGEQKL